MLRRRYFTKEKAFGKTEERKKTNASGGQRRDTTGSIYERFETG